MKNNKDRLLSKNLDSINQFIKINDDKNVIIPLSEILENILKPGMSISFENCIFWLNWILLYEKNRGKETIKCTTRPQEGVNEKFFQDFTWILWDIFLSLDNVYNNIILDLFFIYKHQFKKSNRRQKIDIIILVFLILIDPHPKIKDTVLITEDNYMTKTKIIANINYQYLDVVDNTASEKRDLFQNNFKKLYSPLFSNEKFHENNVEINFEKYTPNKIKQTTNNQKINEKKKC